MRAYIKAYLDDSHTANSPDSSWSEALDRIQYKLRNNPRYWRDKKYIQKNIDDARFRGSDVAIDRDAYTIVFTEDYWPNSESWLKQVDLTRETPHIDTLLDMFEDHHLCHKYADTEENNVIGVSVSADEQVTPEELYRKAHAKYAHKNGTPTDLGWIGARTVENRYDVHISTEDMYARINGDDTGTDYVLENVFGIA